MASPDTTTTTGPDSGRALSVQAIPAHLVQAGDNDRTAFDPAKLAELASSIKANGLAQPITVRANDSGGFEIVAGERRFRAMTEILQWDTVEALVRTYSDDQAADVMLCENLARADLDPIDEAEAYAKRIATGITVEELAERVGVAARRIRWRMDLLGLAEDLRALVRTGNIAVGLAWELAQLDSNRQHIAIKAMTEAELKPSEATALCRKLLADQQQDSMFGDDFMVVEEWAQDIKRRSIGKAGLFDLVGKLTAALDSTGSDDPRIAALLAEAQSVLTERNSK